MIELLGNWRGWEHADGAQPVRTKQGRIVTIRHIRPSDAALLADLFRRLTPHTRRLRFLLPLGALSDDIVAREARRMADIDHNLEAALVATVREEGQERIVGVARLCSADDPAVAEVAFVIRDDYQGEGLGRALFLRLVDVARGRGLRCLQALTLAENMPMRRLIETAGLPFHSHTSHGETMMTINL